MSGIAEVHPDATLTPSKLELLASWLPTQQWFNGDAADLVRVGSFRFVDSFGEVGMETILVQSGDVTYQVPLTYRGEALEGAEEYLVGTLEHSKLGTRHVYDAVGDPVYVDELIRVIREADTEADLNVDSPKSVTVEGSGVVLVSNSSGHVKLHRFVEPGVDPAIVAKSIGRLTASWEWDGQPKSARLASLY